MDLKVLIGLREEVDDVVGVITAPVLQSETKKKTVLLVFFSIALMLINIKIIKFTEISLMGFTIETTTPQGPLQLLKPAIFVLLILCIDGAITDYRMWSRKLIISYLKIKDITERLKKELDTAATNFESATITDKPYREKIKKDTISLTQESDAMELSIHEMAKKLEEITDIASLDKIKAELDERQTKLSIINEKLKDLKKQLKKIDEEYERNYEIYKKHAENLDINLKDLSNSFNHIKHKKMAIITIELGLPIYVTCLALFTSYFM